MRPRWAAMVAALFVGALTAWAGPILYSSFNAGTEGWTVGMLGLPGEGPPPGGTGPVHYVSGGVGGSGYIETEDTADGRLYFKAPASWAGDYYLGTLSFHLREGHPPDFPYNPNTLPAGHEPLVLIEGAGLRLFYFAGAGAGQDWTFNSVPLAEDPAWSKTAPNFTPPTPAEVQTVMSNITGIWINADWVSRWYGKPGGDFGHDITGLDEVRLVPIPEPASYLLAAAGLLLLVLRRRAAA